MKVLVGIPTHKRPESLRACIISIADQAGQLPRIEVLVADNDPTDQQGAQVAGELAKLFPFPLTSVVVEEPGISAVRNVLLTEADARGVDAIAMIDDDETASRNWLHHLIAMHCETGADIVGGRSQPSFAATPSRGAFVHWTPKPMSDGMVDVLSSTANCLITTKILRKQNMPRFNPDFGLTGSGDTEWFERVRLDGATFAWSNAALTFEHVPPERCAPRWLLRRTFRQSNGRARILLLHKRYRELFLPALRALAVIALSPLWAALLLFHRHRWDTLRRFAGATGFLAGCVGYSFAEYGPRHGGTHVPATSTANRKGLLRGPQSKSDVVLDDFSEMPK